MRKFMTLEKYLTSKRPFKRSLVYNGQPYIHMRTEPFASYRYKRIKLGGYLFFSLLIWCFILPCDLLAKSTFKPDLTRELKLANTGESWTSEWRVLDTLIGFPDGGNAGFYRRDTQVGKAMPNSKRTGILYLCPENHFKPVRIVGNDIFLHEGASFLNIGVSANRYPRGAWGLTVRVNNKQISKDIIVEGNKGWQDLSFNLTPFIQQPIDIIIEGQETSHRNAYVFIDYIEIAPTPRQTILFPVKRPSKNKGFFDSAYQYFLKLLDMREEERSQILRDRRYQDQLVEDSK